MIRSEHFGGKIVEWRGACKTVCWTAACRYAICSSGLVALASLNAAMVGKVCITWASPTVVLPANDEAWVLVLNSKPRCDIASGSHRQRWIFARCPPNPIDGSFCTYLIRAEAASASFELALPSASSKLAKHTSWCVCSRDWFVICRRLPESTLQALPMLQKATCCTGRCAVTQLTAMGNFVESDLWCRFGFVATFVAVNFHRVCRRSTSVECAQLQVCWLTRSAISACWVWQATVQEQVQLHPHTVWDDPANGRLNHSWAPHVLNHSACRDSNPPAFLLRNESV